MHLLTLCAVNSVAEPFPAARSEALRPYRRGSWCHNLGRRHWGLDRSAWGRGTAREMMLSRQGSCIGVHPVTDALRCTLNPNGAGHARPSTVSRSIPSAIALMSAAKAAASK